MAEDKMCPYYDKDRGALRDDRERYYHYVANAGEAKSRRVVCPVCKRRLKSKLAIGYDDEVRYIIPRHKRKRWWRR